MTFLQIVIRTRETSILFHNVLSKHLHEVKYQRKQIGWVGEDVSDYYILALPSPIYPSNIYHSK